MHQRTTAEIPRDELDQLLAAERKETPMSVTVHVEERVRPPLPVPLFIAVGLLSGISIGLACLWA